MNLRNMIEGLIRPPQVGHAEEPPPFVGGSTGGVKGYTPVTPPRAPTPKIEYDNQGRAFYWSDINGRPVTIYLGAAWNDPRKAADYTAPRAPASAPAPRYPEGGVSGGYTYLTDPDTGEITWGAQAPGSLTDEQKRENDLTDAALLRRYTVGDRAEDRRYDTGVRAEDRTYRTDEREAGQEFTAGENDEGRRFSAAESALNRALNAGQFASTLQANRQRDEYTADESYQNRIRQYGQDQIAGARTVAELTNSVDPTALPAFYRAGGGNIMNAIQAGASAVSDRAVLPAAQALRGTREMALPSRYTFGALNLPAPVSGSSYQPRVQSPVRQPPPVVRPPTLPTAQQNLAGHIIPTAANSSNFENRPLNAAETAAWQAGIPGAPAFVTGAASAPTPEPAAWTNEQNNAATLAAFNAIPRYAVGTQDVPVGTDTQFISGDDVDPADPFADGADPEAIRINDPTGDATFSVDPMEAPGAPEGEMAKFGAVLRAIAAMITGETPEAPPMPNRYAYGTGTVDPYATIRPGDQPYFDEIRDIRTKTPYEELNPYSTGYMLGSPTMRASYEMGVQGRYGVPVIDQQQQQRRYQVPTASRGAFQLGV